MSDCWVCVSWACQLSRHILPAGQTDQLRIELGQPRLAIVVENQHRVDHLANVLRMVNVEKVESGLS